LLDDLGQRRIWLTYDNGNLEIIPPLPIPEWWKERIGRMIEMGKERQLTVLEELRVWVRSL